MGDDATEAPVFRSSGFQEWFTPLFGGGLGLLVVIGCVRYFMTSRFNGLMVFLLAWGVYNIGFVVFTFSRFNTVTADEDGLTIERLSSTHRYPWSAVRSCSSSWGPLVRGVTVYCVTVGEPPEKTYFVPEFTFRKDSYGGMVGFIRAHMTNQ